MMKKTLFLLIICALSSYGDTILNLDPIKISDINSPHLVRRTLYSLDLNTSAQDTAMFVRKPKGLHILRVDSVHAHELSIIFKVDSGFVDFRSHDFAVLDIRNQKKFSARLNVRYNDIPKIKEISIRSGRGVSHDTLQLSTQETTFATMGLKGSGFFETSHIIFDDPGIQTVEDAGWRICDPPHELQVGLEIDSKNVTVGSKTFHVKNEYAIEGFGRIFLRGAFGPQVLGKIPGFVADGHIKHITLRGEHFSPGVEVSLLPQQGFVHSEYVSPAEIDVDVNLPMLERSKSFRFVVCNPDGRADTTAYFTARTTPLSPAKASPIEHSTVFRGKRVHMLFTVETDDGWRFSYQNSYEITIDGDRFPVIRVVNDSTCEAIIKLEKEDTPSILNQHIFTINQIDRPARWRGVIKSKPSPKIYYMSENRVIHPVDTLDIVLKGQHLDDAVVLIDDPDVTFDMRENRGDLVRLTAQSGKHVSFGSYPLELRINDVPFRFEKYKINVKRWQPFREFVRFKVSGESELPKHKVFLKSAKPHFIRANDALQININKKKINEDAGIQKIKIHGVLMDSSNTIRAHAYDNKTVLVSHGADNLTWRWRIRERIRSGDRIEITLSNPGGLNKLTKVFVVQPHWSEKFHGSTSFVLVKLPFGPEQETQVLNSVGLGITYQPYSKMKFLELDGSFIIGSPTSTKSGTSVDVGFGLSAILWHHLQVGFGTNLTGHSFNSMYMFLGTRFKVALPF